MSGAGNKCLRTVLYGIRLWEIDCRRTSRASYYDTAHRQQNVDVIEAWWQRQSCDDIISVPSQPEWRIGGLLTTQNARFCKSVGKAYDMENTEHRDDRT